MFDRLRNLEFPESIQGFSFTEYLTVFLGLIFALAVAEFFISTGNILRERKRFTFYWEFYLWLFILLDLFIVTWYVYWVRLTYVTEGLVYYFLFTLPNLMIFLIVAVYFPSTKGDRTIDLEQHFHDTVPLFFALFGGYLALGLVTEYVLVTSVREFAIKGQFVYLLLSILNAIFPKVWLRMVMVVLFLLEIGFFFVFV